MNTEWVVVLRVMCLLVVVGTGILVWMVQARRK